MGATAGFSGDGGGARGHNGRRKGPGAVMTVHQLHSDPPAASDCVVA